MPRFHLLFVALMYVAFGQTWGRGSEPFYEPKDIIALPVRVSGFEDLVKRFRSVERLKTLDAKVTEWLKQQPKGKAKAEEWEAELLVSWLSPGAGAGARATLFISTAPDHSQVYHPRPVDAKILPALIARAERETKLKNPTQIEIDFGRWFSASPDGLNGLECITFKVKFAGNYDCWLRLFLLPGGRKGDELPGTHIRVDKRLYEGDYDFKDGFNGVFHQGGGSYPAER